MDRLKLLHEEGFSATVIAKKLGPDFTKGMVLGKLRRLALAEAPQGIAGGLSVTRSQRVTSVASRP